MAIVCCSDSKGIRQVDFGTTVGFILQADHWKGLLGRCIIRIERKIYHIIHFKKKTLNMPLTMTLRRNSVSKTGGMLDANVYLGEVGDVRDRGGKPTRGDNKDE